MVFTDPWPIASITASTFPVPSIASDNAEFSFQVHKLVANARRPALFTIAIREGTVLRGICYAQPLDAALAPFRKILEEWGREATGKECAGIRQ